MRQRQSMRSAGRLALVLIGLLIGGACAELTLRALYHHPALLLHGPARVRAFFQDLYAKRRRIIQLDPTSARHDRELLYTLRPGRFVFENVEFSTPFEVNSLGVRDTEAALVGPEIVVTGDSAAMGWGVQQHETFAALLERATRRRVLNAAISSYGTVREMKLLDRVDLSRARTLIIQYNANDEEENEVFLEAGNRHVPAHGPEVFEPGGRSLRPSPSLALHAFGILRGHEELPEPGPPEPRAPLALQELAARRFLNAVVHAPTKDLRGLRLIVFDVDTDPGFVNALDRIRREPRWPPHVRAMSVLDLSAKMEAACTFVLDEHPGAAGHRMIAEALIRAIDR